MDTTVVGPPERRNEQLKGRTSTVSQMFGTDLAGRSLPARGLFWSITVHVFGAVISLYVPWSYWFPPDVHLITAQSVIQDHEISYLPDLQPIGSRIPAPPLKQTKEEEASASSDSAKAVHGVVYQGPQLIVSNPPHPDNFVQTIRQPDLPVRPKLPAPLQLPPMVSVAPAKPILAPPAPRPIPEVPHQNQPVQLAAAAPIRLPPQTPKVEAPKLPLPASSAEAMLRNVANAAAPASMPTLAHQNSAARNGDQAHNVLVVSAIPVPAGKPPVLPMGELAGSFIVSPQPMPTRPGSAAMGSAGGGLEAKGMPGAGGMDRVRVQVEAAVPMPVREINQRAALARVTRSVPVLDPAPALITAALAAKGQAVAPALEDAPPAMAVDRELAPVTVPFPPS